jgi:hypothetical protein
MDAGDLSIIHHIGLVLLALWAAASVGWCHSVVFILAFLYLYMASILLLFPAAPSETRFSYSCLPACYARVYTAPFHCVALALRFLLLPLSPLLLYHKIPLM